MDNQQPITIEEAQERLNRLMESDRYVVLKVKGWAASYKAKGDNCWGWAEVDDASIRRQHLYRKVEGELFGKALVAELKKSGGPFFR